MSHIDCDKVLEQLWSYLDGEVDEAAAGELEEHIEHCLDCRDHAGFERRLREVLRQKCLGERAPTELRTALMRLLDKPQQ